ncbi:MAG: hypothetical protein QM762_15005 [Chryseolinea sp.]
MESNEELTESELRKKAYLIALRLKNSGLDAEAVYARLEKQGIPEEMAKRIAFDTQVQRKQEVIKEAEEKYDFSLYKVGIGAAAGIVSYAIFSDSDLLPIGLIAGGIIAALIAWHRMKQ